MKRFLLILWILITQSQTLLANTSLTLLNQQIKNLSLNNDNFQELLAMANQGKTVSLSALEGVYIGRCYDMVNRNLPRNSVLSAIRVVSSQKSGPLFPDTVEKVVIEGGYPDSSSDFADSKSREILISDLLKLKSKYSIKNEDPLTVALIDSPVMSSTITFYKNGTYIISQYSADKDFSMSVRGDGILAVKQGDVWATCYYFNKK